MWCNVKYVKILVGVMVRMFAFGTRDLGSILGRCHSKNGF